MALGVPSARGAWAQGGGASAADEEAARLYAEGMTAVEAKDWAKARDLLDRAYKARKHWKIAVNLGRVEVELGRSRDAAEHLEYFLKNADPSSVLPADRQKVLDLLNQVRLKVATVAVTVDVSGADVSVDGKVVGKSPLPERVFVEPGKHVVEAKREGYRPAQEPVDLAAGGTREVVFEMVRSTGSGAPKGGGGAKGGGEEGSGGEDVSGYGPTKYPDEDREKPGWQTAAMWAGIGLAVVGTGVGIGFTIAALDKQSAGMEKADVLKFRTEAPKTICQDDLRFSQPWRDDECSQIIDLVGERDTFKTIAIIGFAGAGVGAAAALTFGLLPGRSVSSKASMTIVPLVSASAGGLVLGGAF
jgi:hypothetical protein